MTEEEMVGWHHPLKGNEFEQTLGDGEGQSVVWHAVVHGVTKSWTRLSDFHSLTRCHVMTLFAALNNLVISVYLSKEDNGTPLQYSCLENPMDGGAW